MGSGTGGCAACVHGLAGVSHGPHANKIYVSGDYCNFDGLSSRRGLIRLNPDGTLDSSFPANMSVSGGPFTQMSISPENGILQGGGYTDAIAGVGTGGYLVFDQNDQVSRNDARNHLMLGNAAEVKATAFVFNGTEWLSVIGGRWGGRGGQYSGSVVKIDPETGVLDQDFAARVPISWGVSTVEIGGTAPNQKIYVGGWFDGTFGTPNRLDGLMRLNLNGSLDTSWKLTPNADAHYYMDVYSMEYHNGKLWVGFYPNGQSGYEIFTTQGLFRVDDNGVIDTTFSNGTLFGHSSYGDLEINTIEWNPVANCMLVGGDFETTRLVGEGSASAQKRLTCINEDGTRNASFLSSAGPTAVDANFTNHHVYDVVFNGDHSRLWALGSFNSVHGNTVGGLVELNPSTGGYLAFNPLGTNSAIDVYKGIEADGVLYLSGRIFDANTVGTTSNHLVKVNLTGPAVDSTFVSNIGSGVQMFESWHFVGAMLRIPNAMGPDRLFVGGSIAQFNGDQASFLLRLTEDGLRDDP